MRPEEQEIRKHLADMSVQGEFVGSIRNKDGTGDKWHRFRKTEDRLADYAQASLDMVKVWPLPQEQIDAIVSREMKHRGLS